jgi:hypothetical protein
MGWGIRFRYRSGHQRKCTMSSRVRIPWPHRKGSRCHMRTSCESCTSEQFLSSDCHKGTQAEMKRKIFTCIEGRGAGILCRNRLLEHILLHQWLLDFPCQVGIIPNKTSLFRISFDILRVQDRT